MSSPKLSKFWGDKGLQYVIPNDGGQYPECFDVAKELSIHLGKSLPIVEVGCGYGRIGRLFDSTQYKGLDINPNAINRAKRELPGYHFETITDLEQVPTCDTLLVYTVLLHIPDEEILNSLTILANRATNILVVEIMDKRWRSKQVVVPVYNRDPEEYILLLQQCNKHLKSYSKKPYAKYAKMRNPDLDDRITFMLFGPEK